MKNDIYIMIDLETLGVFPDAPIIQIAAIAFKIHNKDNCLKYEKIKELNIKVKIDDLQEIEKDTLIWWLETNPNLLLNLLNDSFSEDGIESFGEKEAMFELQYFITQLDANDKDIYLIGNGVMFDNNFIRTKMNKHKIEYPIYYTNDLDFRTHIKLGCINFNEIHNTNLDVSEYKTSIHKFRGVKHNAYFDVINQIELFITVMEQLVLGKKEGEC